MQTYVSSHVVWPQVQPEPQLRLLPPGDQQFQPFAFGAHPVPPQLRMHPLPGAEEPLLHPPAEKQKDDHHQKKHQKNICSYLCSCDTTNCLSSCVSAVIFAVCQG